MARQTGLRDRIAVWGWSGGDINTLNLMFRSPDVYKVGVSVAPVPDQTLYDTLYRERYMRTPQENAEGYAAGSAVHFADGLRGNLLLIHGSGDDNVHYQGSEKLINRLVELGKPFEFMEYPNRHFAALIQPARPLHRRALPPTTIRSLQFGEVWGNVEPGSIGDQHPQAGLGPGMPTGRETPVVEISSLAAATASIGEMATIGLWIADAVAFLGLYLPIARI